ncbi:hypothetical protein V2S66_23985 [Streptomyces sp. V4-01]|uniref:DUF5642 domain-containing protein n=1 Tax=Actinacidiphila polyblastidii TaxID=3110430 RepID=A0ABU7PI88_9ACTN|nr:hypothetical protein [Streptomyces sp. V4-01]
MITEPEMSDGQGGELPAGVPGEPGAAAVVAGGRTAPPWLWAVGGVVVASAVWAAVLHGSGATGPDLHGYRLAGNPCDGGTLSPLKDALGARGFAVSDATVSRAPAVDKLSCVLSADVPAGGGWMTGYTVSVSVELHKRTDPRAEFEDAGRARVSSLPGSAAQDGSGLVTVATTDYLSAADVHPVEGVGDEAYLLEPRASDQTLDVLHGGAVLTLQVSGYSRWNGPGESPLDTGGEPPEPDLTGLRPALTTAMRHLMTSLAS